MADLSNELIIAIANAIASKLVTRAKKELPQDSSFGINALVRIEGKGSKGVDSSQRSPAKVKFDLLSGIALSHVNEATRNAIVAEYADMMQDNDSADEKALATATEIKDAAETAIQGLVDECVVHRTGTVKFNGDVEVIEVDLDTLTA